jgi:hypothetical protein
MMDLIFFRQEASIIQKTLFRDNISDLSGSILDRDISFLSFAVFLRGPDEFLNTSISLVLL